MQLDRAFLESVISLYDELNSNGIYIVYIGKFTNRVTSIFSTMLEEELEKRSEDKKTKRRVFHAMVETMQNIQRHADEFTGELFTNGLFMIGKKAHIYYIITINKVNTKNKQQLSKSIDTVNNSTIEELNEMYKAQLKNGKIGEHGGAGLGLIDIARKTDNKIDYMFIPINIAEEYFILKAEIDPAKFDVNTPK